ncbi:succinyl transferase OpgC [Corallococcus exiguus]|uniref:OpgC domain-containing protein n=1 Tax=Corallococcus TaxID=83461 RepID=UPI000EA20426|nr:MULTISPECIES: OpgC domain-containing protein [Corallococcus]NNC15128.1 succinyl transferase OpgC [Corallococcus exiguus]RKH27206.1 OpgC domain-containing protein [Corallococcus sp. CA041A]RKI12771.1 OpgC domain-containing protein [Corallococcus sp. AB030]RUO94269.1 OpgC domain-containing protein [Corallococcus sp. AB018]
MKRRPEFDSLRGVLLVLMTLTHLPTRLSVIGNQPFGFVSAAEGFVFLSAFLVGVVHAKKLGTSSPVAMFKSLWSRALKVYGYHVALLSFAFTIIATLGVAARRPAIHNLLGFFHQDPFTALWSSLFLLYCPPLLDILPLYVVLLLLTPAVLLGARKEGWSRVLGLSALIWVWAQVGLKRALYDLLVAIPVLPWPPLSIDLSGAFDLFAWQFLWVLGVWMGVARATAPEQREPVSRRLLTGAIVVSLGFFVVRHLDVDLGAAGVLFDKWSLAPLRLVNFLAVALLASWLAPRLFQWLRPKVLEALGQASLPVFAVHVVLCLLSLSLLDENEDPLDYWDEVAVLVATFCSMYFVALRQRIAGRSVGPPSTS